ncbi:hypothetical protein SETIT_2G248400v2 [Setaria italica]|uniref:Ubiquitin-like domain-containing protein n=1 Tax=Setaria italica TaxID=4555 RepID=K4A190_SETIT|nr:uncharacterized protein LOC101763744 [Setaria italica]RCV12172.1 hypothetical protein SETIT_2G248400v2 [Setaria italica]
MDVSFACAGEEPFEMEVGFFDTVQDIKEKLQSRRGWPAATMSLLHNGDVLVDDGGGGGGGIERHGIVEGSVIHVALVPDGPRQQRQVKRNRPASKRRGVGEEGAPPPLRVTVVSRCGAGRVEVAVAARAAVSALRAELERARGAGFPLPGGGAYFFIHRQSVMDEARSFQWHGVAAGDEVVVFDGSVTRAPAY